MDTTSSTMLIPANSDTPMSPEKWWYIHWLTLPSPDRRPGTQRELANYLHVHPVTLTRWKGELFVRQTVLKLISRRTLDQLPNVLDTVYSKAMEGSPAHIRIFLEYASQLVDLKSEESMDPAEAEVSASIDSVESKYGPYQAKAGSPEAWMDQLRSAIENTTSHQYSEPSPQN